MRGLSRTVVATAALAVMAMGTASFTETALAQETDQPNISGVWMAFATDPGGRLGAMSPDLTAAGKAAVAAFSEEHGADMPEAGWYCVGTGMPYVMTSLAAYPIEVLQTPGRVTMLAEMEQQVRRIHVDGRDAPTDYPRTRIGYSIADWEGETLVVHTSNFKEWPLGSAPRSEDASITERFHMTTRGEVTVPASGFVAAIAPINDRVLVDQMTLTDPLFYSKPHTVTIYYQAVADDQTLEYDCPVDLWQRALEGTLE